VLVVRVPKSSRLTVLSFFCTLPLFIPMPSDNGEFRGATTAQIEYLKDQLRDIRSDMKEIAVTLSELKDFKTKVLAYAGLAAAIATLCIQFIFDKLG